MAVSIVIGCEVNSQSVANNSSNVTCWVSAVWTGGSYNLLEKSGYLIIDGTKYTFTSPFNTGRTTEGSVRMFTKTVNVTHTADGTKTLALSASYTSGVSSGTVAASASVKLDAITRASVLSKPPSTGTLGEKITFTINRQGSSDIGEQLYYMYKLSPSTTTRVYAFADIIGNASGGYVSDSKTTWTKAWTPSLSFANNVTDSATVTGTLHYTCRSNSEGNALLTKQYTLNLKIPDSVKPSVECDVTEATSHIAKYGNPIKGLTTFGAELHATIAYGSPIKNWTITVGKTAYDVTKSAGSTENIVKSGLVPHEAGEVKFIATVTDARGRTGSATITKNVLDYTQPVIEKLTVLRCNFDGTENDQGEYIRVKFSATVTPLNNVNTAAYTLRYKRSTDSSYTSVNLAANSLTDGQQNAANTASALIASNRYSVTDAVYIFKADSGSSYNVEVQATDDFKTETRTTSASTAFTLMHWKTDGTGMAIGKISEESNLFDLGMPTRFNEPVYGNVMGLNKLPEIPAGSDFNDYMTTGAYAVYRNDNAATIKNIPVASAGRLEVSSTTGEGLRVSEWSYLRQRFIPYMLGNATWERDITRSNTNIWEYGEWYRTNLSAEASGWVYNPEQKVLWGASQTSGMYMSSTQKVDLSEKVSEQRNGIILVFCYYNGTGDTNWGWQTAYVPKILVALEPGESHIFKLSNTSFGVVGTKYLYINDGSITGHSSNDLTKNTASSGITYNNSRFVLRYVIGV